MSYKRGFYKNVKAAEIYKVSEKTVGNWISMAKKGLINLELYNNGRRDYLLNSNHNHTILKDLALRGRKYKNTKSLRKLKPTPKFYQTFSIKEIIHIINSIELRNEIPQKYLLYSSEELEYRYEYEDYLITKKNLNYVTSTIELLNHNAEYISRLTDGYDKVNIIDILGTNPEIIKDFVKFFVNKGMLISYISLCSNEIVSKVLKTRITDSFKKIPARTYIRDVSCERFQDVLFLNSEFNEGESDTINLVLFLGNKFEYINQLNSIYDSFSKTDILILDRRGSGGNSIIEGSGFDNKLRKNRKDRAEYMLEMLNIKSEYYELENLYDESLDTLFMVAKLKYDIYLKFNIEGCEKSIKLNQKDYLILQKYEFDSYINTLNTLSEIGFEIVHSTTSTGDSNILVVSKIMNNTDV